MSKRFIVTVWHGDCIVSTIPVEAVSQSEAANYVLDRYDFKRINRIRTEPLKLRAGPKLAYSRSSK